MEALDPRDAWPTWVLSNHDSPRHRTRVWRFGTARPRRGGAAAVLRGTPFLYAGEELGLEDAEIPPDQAVDPGGRDGCRAPIPWDPGPDHGWDSPAVPPGCPGRHKPITATPRPLSHDPASILHLYRQLLAVRSASPALALGDLELLAGPDSVVAFRRERRGT